MASGAAREEGRPVAVLGAGTMGHGIAQAVAAAGRPVRLQDPSPSALEEARRRIEENLERGVSLGKVAPKDREAVLERIRTTPSLPEAVSGAHIVIEAVPEELELKRSVLREVAAHAAPDALLATNTSAIPVDAIAGALERPERFVGLHFFNPAHIAPLVEVVHGPRTAAAAREGAVAFVRELGKEPIVVRDSPGFASSRLGLALGLEAIRMVEERVASPEDIDRAMELGYRHPMGPLRLTDLVGLDVRLAIAEVLHRELGSPRFEPPELLRRMVRDGKLGRKSGEGFYRWDD